MLSVCNKTLFLVIFFLKIYLFDASEFELGPCFLVIYIFFKHFVF